MRLKAAVARRNMCAVYEFSADKDGVNVFGMMCEREII
jgi:hypothetical protein